MHQIGFGGFDRDQNRTKAASIRQSALRRTRVFAKCDRLTDVHVRCWSATTVYDADFQQGWLPAVEGINQFGSLCEHPRSVLEASLDASISKLLTHSGELVLH